MQADGQTDKGKSGFPTFHQPPDARPITLEDVKRAEEASIRG
jgi:hypothetical protein